METNPKLAEFSYKELCEEIHRRNVSAAKVRLKENRPNLRASLTKDHYIVQPACHGNGGWCGSDTLAKGKVFELTDIHPILELGAHVDGQFGDDRIRICTSEDPNKTIAVFDAEEGLWKTK